MSNPVGIQDSEKSMTASIKARSQDFSMVSSKFYREVKAKQRLCNANHDNFCILQNSIAFLKNPFGIKATP